MTDQTQPVVYLAGFWRRLVAYLIDSIVLSVITAILLGIVGLCLTVVFPIPIFELVGAIGDSEKLNQILTESMGGLGVLTAVRGYLSWILLQVLIVTPLWTGWLYYALLESSDNSATLGKMAMNIVVSDLHGRRVTFERATGRYFAKIITGFTFGIGWLMAAFSSRKQALHDIVAGCLILYRAPADYYEDEFDDE
jgi:uncharacterized RDD family membrane protein YckC